MVISHNLLAMNAQRQFNITGTQKKKSTEKLASGYKINRAADDAAGLAISEKMRRQIRGLDQGARNTQDGISLLQVADGALSEVHDMLHRMSELAVQAANDTNTSDDRAAIQQEINQIVSEIDRIGNGTEFNTRKLFKGEPRGTDETGRKYRIEYETITTTYTETVEDINTYTETVPAHYGVSSISASGQLTDTSNNRFLLTADETGLHINTDLYKWSEIYSSGGDALSSLGQYQSYNIAYNGSTITINTADCTDIKSLINSLDGVEIDYTENSRSVTSPIISISADPFIVSDPRTWTIDSNDNTTISISATDNAIFFKSGKKTVGTVPWSRVKYTEGTDTVDVELKQFPIPVRFTLNKTDNYEEDFKGILQSGALPSIVCHGDYKYSAASDYSITVNGSQTYNMGVYNLEEALADIGFTGGTVVENKKATGTIYSHGVHDIYFDLNVYGSSKKMRFYLDDTGDVRLDRNTNAGEYFFYRFYYQNQDKTTSNAYVEIPIKYNYDMSASETRKDLYHRNVSINFASEYTPQSIDLGASSGVVTTKKYSIDGLNDAPDETITREEITYHDEERTREEVIEKKVYIDDDEEDIEQRELWIQSGAEVGDGMFITIGTMNAGILGVNNIRVTSHDDAGKAIEAASEATEIVSALRSNIGAQQNRLEHTFKNVTNISENTQAAESRIRDTDMAKEMVELSKHNILEQVGTSMIAQANQSNQGVLSLLQ